MKQKLHIFMTLLLLMICGGVSFGQEVTLDFTKNSWNLPTSNTKDTKQYSNGTYTISLSAPTAYKYVSGYLLLGKKNATLTLPTFDFDVEKIVVTGRSGASSAVKQNIYVGNQAVSTETTGASGEKSYSISKDYQVAGNTYVLKVTSSHNTQITKIEVYKVKTSTTLSFGADYDGKTITKNVGDIWKTLATLSPSVEGATITYESSDETVAEVADGVVEAKKEGTAIITAKFAGNDNYNASSASYTLNVEDASKIVTTLGFQMSSYAFEVGSGDQEFTNAAILNPAEAGSVAYKSSNENIAIVGDDGSVIVSTDKVGTATITATFAGNDKYRASEASYTIIVKKAVKDGVFDFSAPDLYGYDVPQNNKEKVTLEKAATIVAGNVTLTNTKNGSSTTTRFYNNSGTIGLRAYTDAVLTVSVPESYVITDISIEANYKDVFTIGALNKNTVEIDFSDYTQMQSMTVKYTKLATLTTAASGFATYAADYDVDYSAAGLKAYAITLDDAAKTVKYTEATGVVPAGKAVLVKGEAKKEYTLAPATVEAADFATDLQISDGTVTTEGGLYYAFATVDGKSGFKKLADGLTIPAKKGYLKLSAASAKGFFAFDETTTGINEIEAEAAQDNAAIYNLAGQRVSKEYKGVVIKNGKKFFNK